MNIALATQAIMNAFEAQWPGLSGGVPFVEKDESGDELPTFARISIQWLQGQQGTLGQTGNHKNIRRGIIHVQVFAPPDAGSVPVATLAQHVVTIFDRKSIGAGGEIKCELTDPSELETEDQYAGLKMSTRFWFFEAG